MVFQTVFSRFYVFPFTLMFCIIRSKFFDLYCTFAHYNKRIIMHVFKTVKGVTKTDILCAIIQHNVHVVFNRKNIQECFKLNKSKK